MRHVLVIGGLTQEAHDRVRAESAKKLAPDGHVVMRPIRTHFGYPADAGARLLDDARAVVRAMPEDVRVAMLLAYVDYGDASTAAFKHDFFPFCLTHPVPPIEVGGAASKRQSNEGLNIMTRNVVAAAVKLRAVARRVSEHTNLPNITPLLLPVRNFQAPALGAMLDRLFDQLASSANPASMLDQELSGFLAHHPHAKPPGAKRHCLSDGRHYFKSPGSDRHGFYRNSADHQHGRTCLLNARSRLGGAYDHRFHFDCEACNGSLAGTYPNCHGQQVPPKPTHVNVAPSDAII